jgi:Na+-translocating ferredoxin:NAD+ oxidoreductase RnfG subunit
MAKHWGKLGFLIASSAVPLVAYAHVYLSEEQALGSLFPGEKFTRKLVELKPDEVKKIEDVSGERVRNTSLVVWTGAAGNTVIIDQALGKHEFITYALGLTKARAVEGIEILEYRETYGYQIREEPWRKQFQGKDAKAALKLGKDIVNISGATLSCSHVTGGVRRLLQTYEVIRERI